MCDCGEIFFEGLNPKFLYAGKGTRNKPGCPYHSHDYLEILFILSGQGKYRIDDQIYEVSEGDLLILNPHVKHEVLMMEEIGGSNTHYFVAMSDFQLKGMEKNFLPSHQDGPILHTTGELRQQIFRICSAMEMENSMCRPGRYYMLRAYVVQLLMLLIREQFEPMECMNGYSFESVNKKYVVERILDYFEEHYNEKISLDQIADNMYLSPFYISKIFKSETGDTPIRHLINIRLEKAYELLKNGWSGSIQEAAACVGYEDAYHFSKVFKKRYGVPPSKVKKGQ